MTDYEAGRIKDIVEKIDAHVKKEKDLQLTRDFIQSMVNNWLGSWNLDHKNMAGRWIKVKDQLELAVNLEKSLNKWTDTWINHYDLTDLVNEHLKQ